MTALELKEDFLKLIKSLDIPLPTYSCECEDNSFQLIWVKINGDEFILEMTEEGNWISIIPLDESNYKFYQSPTIKDLLIDVICFVF